MSLLSIDKEDPIPPKEKLRIWKAAYYGVLNAHGDFQSSLQTLFEDFRRSPMPEHAPLASREKAFAKERRRHGASLRTSRPPSARMQKAFEEFSHKWSLPRLSWVWVPREPIPDLYFSFRRWRLNKGIQAELRVGPIVSLVEFSPTTICLQADEFTYDPLLYSPAKVRDLLKDSLKKVKNDALEQIAQVEKKLTEIGWQSLPPQHRDPEKRHDLAHRLFRRVVLNHTWPRIAKADLVDVRAAMQSVERLADFLEITLPRKRGRKKRQK